MHVQKCEGIKPNEDKSGERMGSVFFDNFMQTFMDGPLDVIISYFTY